MMSVEMSMIKERLEKILPHWSVNDELEAVTKSACFDMDTQQMNQIMSVGLFISRFYHQRDTTVIEFSKMNSGGSR
jgi:hypothetical protein